MQVAAARARIPFLVDRIFPAREVHLIGGPSGSGKTRLMFQVVTDWIAGRDVFEEKSHPVPFYYVSCDRSLDSVHRTLDDLGISRTLFPILSTITDKAFETCPTMPNWADMMRVVKERQPDTRALFVDGFATLAGEAKYHGLHRFLAGVTRDCHKHDLTIWGSAHATKMKADSKIPNQRQRILGSVGWAGFCDTIITIEPTKDDDPLDPTRQIIIMPRNSSSISLQYIFDSQGRLSNLLGDTCSYFMEAELERMPLEGEIKTEFFVQAGLRYTLDRRTIERWIKRACEDEGLLSKVGHGTYRKLAKQ